MLTREQFIKYLGELRYFVRFVYSLGYNKVPDHMRTAVKSHARHLATGPHAVWEKE